MTSNYRHRAGDGRAIDLPVGKVVCVGRNYAAHARELNNPVPETPLLFIKPATALVPLAGPLHIPGDRGTVHHELELALLIGKPLGSGSAGDPLDAVTGVGLALDLTLRDLQAELKARGHPWEIAKAFDGSCPCSGFLDANDVDDLQAIDFRLIVNGELRQTGNTRDMLFPIPQLLTAMASYFTLLPGDIVLTGTPAGVGPIQAGDHLSVKLSGVLHIEIQVMNKK